jgi:aryl-alcohol dehydrogenase-like predicted oxidoreductase
MQYRTIRGTDVKVSAVSLGCWTLGGLQYNEGRMIGWREPDEAEVRQAVHAAVDAGVNHFDNADVYGYGRAERSLTRALQGVSKQVIVATKVGYFRGTAEHAYQPHHIRAQCEGSLVNLRRERLDIYYLHNCDFGEQGEYLDGAVETMQRLRQEGKVRLIGLSGDADGLAQYAPKVKPDLLQGRASMIDRRNLDPGRPARKMMEGQKLQLVCFSPLEQGILLGKYSAQKPPQFEDGDVRKQRPAFTAEGLAKVEDRIEKLKARFGSSPRELAAAALAFLLAHEHVLCPIPGFRNLEQVKSNVVGGGEPMKPEDAEFVRRLFA